MDAYIHSRRSGLVDLFIDKLYRAQITVNDGTSGDATDSYTVQVNNSVFTVDDGTPGSDISNTISSNLVTAINNSNEPVTASASGNIIDITHDIRGREFHWDTRTTDSKGSIYGLDKSAEKYEVKQATNWDGSFTTMETVGRNGARSSYYKQNREILDAHSLHSSYLEGKARFLFDPKDYSLDDDDVIFLKIAPVVDGVTQSDGRVIIIPTERQVTDSHAAMILKGTAPKATDEDSATELMLPSQTTSVEVKNIGDTAETVYLSFGSGSAEIPLGQGDAFSDNKLNTRVVTVRTDNSASSGVDVYVYATMNENAGL